MKNIGEILGLIGGGTAGVSLVASFSRYSWWELVFIFAWLLIWALFGGAIGMLIDESIKSAKEEWNGKRTQSKEPS